MTRSRGIGLAPGEYYSAVSREVEAIWLEQLSGRDLGLMLALKTIPGIDTAAGGLTSHRDIAARYPRAVRNEQVKSFLKRVIGLRLVRYMATERQCMRLRLVTCSSELPALSSVYHPERREVHTPSAHTPFKERCTLPVRTSGENGGVHTPSAHRCTLPVRTRCTLPVRTTDTTDTETPSPRGVSLSLSLAKTRDAAGPPREGPTAPESTTTLRTPSERDEHDPELAALIGGLGVAPGRDDEREHREHLERLRQQLEMVRRGEL